jgi:predicted esterase
MKEFFLSLDHYRVRGHVWGEKHLPTIVCLHGLGNTSLSFIEIAEELKEEYKIKLRHQKITSKKWMGK